MLDASTKQTRPETAADEPRARCDASRCHVLELCSSDHLTAAACLMQELHREMAGRYAGDPRFVECFLDRRHCERELSRLPGAYAPPGGAILLAVCGDEELVGCVALRHAGDDACELQRLYVRPAWRGRGFGKALVASALTGARARGYRIVRAAPMDAQWEARLLLRALDFEEDDSTTGHARKPDRRWQLMELDFERILDQAQTWEEASR
ncbi:MAG: GNAT family N-acetyltransferase, partial [Gammaproteobacteria bacterium]|nr:GNAT family N-acetyltransferase [Gammaproteobacteria bacterium]